MSGNILTPGVGVPYHLPHAAGTSIADILSATTLGIMPGDFLLWDGTGVIPASSYAWDTSLANTQLKAGPKFVGIAAGRVTGTSAAGTILVQRSGVIVANCASASFAKGDYVTFAQQSGSALERQKVVATTKATAAIGIVLRPQTSVTQVEFQMLEKGVEAREETISFYFPLTSTAGDIVKARPFGKRVKLKKCEFVTATAITSADMTISFEKNDVAFTAGQTVVVATSGSTIGKVLPLDFNQALPENAFEPDDILDIATDGGGDAGAGTILLTYAVIL